MSDALAASPPTILHRVPTREAPPVGGGPPTGRSDDEPATPVSDCEHAPVMKILSVDDDVDVADSMGLLFEAMGHEVRIAYRGDQALPISVRFVPHVTFLDLKMPGIDGFAAARQIRAASPIADHPFLVALSGLGDLDVAQRANDAGFDLYLRKPADTTLLLPIIDSLARRQHPSVPA